LSTHDDWLFSLVLSHVSLEEVFRAVDVLAEVEIVNFSDVTLVKILSNKNLVQFFAWWKKSTVLEDSPELFGGDVERA
jgi:hypothetical protein